MFCTMLFIYFVVFPIAEQIDRLNIHSTHFDKSQMTQEKAAKNE